MFRNFTLGLSVALAPACVTTRVEGDGAGGASNYVILERDASTDGSPTTVSAGMTPLTPELRNQLEATACYGWASEGEANPALLMFVVDTSASMNDKTTSTGSRTKWEIARDSLKNTIDHLPKAVRLGMLLYPNQNTAENLGSALDIGNCVNTYAMIATSTLGITGSAQRQALALGLDNALIQGGTPTADAYEYAHNSGLIPAMDAGTSNPYMVLITDGEPTLSMGCMGSGRTPTDTNAIIELVSAAWANQGIRTYVIGAPGSEKSAISGADVRAWLSSAATAGHTPYSGTCSDTGMPNFCHLDLSQVADFSSSLQQALLSIAGQVLSCSYALPSSTASGAAIDPRKINVIYDVDGDASKALLIGQTDSSCLVPNGWYLDSAGNIQLCLSACKAVQQDPNAVLRILGGCQSISVVN